MAWLGLALLVPIASAAGQDAARQDTLPPALVAGLEAAARGSLPVAGDFVAYTAWARRWRPARGVVLALLPVSFQPAAPSFPNQRRWCGIAVQVGEDAPTALATLGTDWTEAVTCDGLREAGEAPPAGGAPRFALIYAARSPNTAVRVPVILRWDAAAGRVLLDEAASRAVDEAGRGGSLRQVRAALRAR